MTSSGVEVFRLVHEDLSAGYVAIRKMPYQWKRRRGLHIERWSSEELEANVYMPSEGRPSGFDVVTGMSGGIEQGSFDYRGTTYGLLPIDPDEAREVWNQFLSDE